MSAPVREMKLAQALSSILDASWLAEAILRAGSCPKCGAGPVNESGEPDDTFALDMCSDDDWSAFHHALVEAEGILGDVELDRHRPGPASIRECEAAMVQLDLAMSVRVRP